MTTDIQANVNNTPATNTEQGKKLSRQRAIVISVLSVVAGLVMLVLLLPTLLSTSWGAGLIAGQVNSRMAGELRFGKLSLGWFSGQRIENLVIRDAARSADVVMIKAVDLPGVTLWRLLTGSRALGVIRIDEPVVHVERLADGSLNLAQVFSSPTSSATSPKSQSSAGSAAGPISLSADLSGQLLITDGRIIFKQPGAGSMTGQSSEVRDLQVDVKLANTQSLVGDIKAQVTEGQQASDLQAKLKVDPLTDAQHVLQLDRAKVDAQVELDNLPVSLVEVFTGQPGRLRELLGDQITGKATIAGDAANLSAQLTASSANASVALQAQRVTQNDQSLWMIKPGSKLRLTLTPSALSAWSPVNSEGHAQAVKLLEPMTLAVVFENVRVSEKGGRIVPAQTTGTVQMSLSEAALDLGGDTGVVTLRDTQGQLQFINAPQPALQLNLRSTALAKGQSGRVMLDMTLRDLLDAQGQLQTGQVNGSIQASIINWPTALIDMLAKTDGLLTQVLGATVGANLQSELHLHGNGGKPTGQVTLSVNSKQLQGQLKGHFDEKGLVIPAGQTFTYVATPQIISDLWVRFTSANSALRQVKIARPMELMLTLGDTQLPMKGNPLTGLQMQAALTASNIDLQGLPGSDSLQLDDTRWQLNYDGPKRTLNADLAANLYHGKAKAPVGFMVQLTDFITTQGQITPATTQGSLVMRAEKLPTAILDGLVSIPDFGATALGKTINLHLSADLTPSAFAKATLPKTNYVFMAVADRLSFKANGQIDDQNITLQTSEPARFTIEPALVDVLRKHPNIAPMLGRFSLEVSSTISLDPLRLSLPRAAKDLKSALQFGGKLQLNRLSLHGDARLLDVVVSDLSLDVLDTTLAQGIDAKLTAAVQHQRQTGRVLANIKLNDLLGNTAGGPVFKIPARLDQFPVSVIDQWMIQPGKYTALLGDKLDRVEVIDLSNTAADRSDYGFNVLIQSEQVAGPIKGHFKPGEVVVIEEGSRLTVNLTPQRIPALQKHWLSPQASDKALVLVEPTSLDLLVNQAKVRFTKPTISANEPPSQNQGLAIDPAASSVQLALTAKPMRWRLPDKQLEVDVTELNLTLGGANLAEEQTLQLRSVYQVRSSEPARTGVSQQNGQVTSTTRLRKLFDDQGRFNTINMGFSTQTGATALPVVWLDELLGQQGKLIAALGPSVDADITAQHQPGQGGPVQARITSANLNTNLAAQLDRDMVLSLREDAQLTFNLTRELAQQYLSSVNFLLRDAQSSQGPVRLTLTRDGFALPLRNLGQSMDKARMTGRLELGTLRVRRGPGGELVGLLRLAGARIENRDEFDAIFSPLTFDLKEGLLTCSDLWMDTGDLRIGSQSRVFFTGRPTTPWGEVLLAIPGDTVLVVPGTRGRIDPRAIYTVGSIGPLNAIKPDLASLIKRIIAPVAGQAIGGDVGAAVGIGTAIFGAISEGQRRPDQRDPDWFARAAWPNRPALQIPAVSQQAPAGTSSSPSPSTSSSQQPAPQPQPAQGQPQQPAAQPQPAQGQPHQPDGNQPTAKPEEEIIRGLLQGLTKPQPRRESEPQR